MGSESFCSECGGILVVRTEPHDHEIKGRVVRVENDRHLTCEKCGAVSYQGEMLDEVGRAIARQIRLEDGLLSPEEIKVVRLKYGFTQSDMEKLLTLGPKTWIRWERGSVCQSRAADQMIRAIAKDPGLVRDLMASTGVSQPKALEALDAIEHDALDKLREKFGAQFPTLEQDVIEKLAILAIGQIRYWQECQIIDLRRVA